MKIPASFLRTTVVKKTVGKKHLFSKKKKKIGIVNTLLICFPPLKFPMVSSGEK